MFKDYKTKLTGASDDLIEIEGEIREEFSDYDCSNGRIAFSDGTLIGVNYSNEGIWRFNLIVKGSLYLGKEEGNVDEDINDVVYFKEGLKWVVYTSNEYYVGIETKRSGY